MVRQNFWDYNKESEEPGKDYWQFLDATGEELKKEWISLDSVAKIIKNVTNEELKQKMRLKLYELVTKDGLFYNTNMYVLEAFSIDVSKQILEKELNDIFEIYSSGEEALIKPRSEIFELVSAFSVVNDNNWEFTMVSKILDIVKDYSDKTFLVNLIERYSRNPIYKVLIKKYYDYLPIEYKTYLLTEEDRYYVYNKTLQFIDIDIGIDPRISIGPEIEANKHYAFSLDLRNQIGLDEYSIHSEVTVPNGNEITPSKPFHNIPKEVAKFCALCETLKEIGYYYDEEWCNAAGQINLGLDYLDTKEAILNFYEIYGNCEELLYYISSEEGQLFRQGVYTNSRIKALSEIIGKRIFDEELTRLDVIKLFNKDHEDGLAIKGLQYKKNSVCLRGSYDGDLRLEFRIPNGGCNYKTWIDNIRLYGKMLEASKKLADVMKKDYLTEEEEKLLKIKIDMQDNNLSLEEKLHMLMYLLFQDDPIKKVYYDRYSATIRRIEETNTTKYKNDNQVEPNFDTVLFEEKYQSRLDPDYIGENSIEYDPESGIIR